MHGGNVEAKSEGLGRGSEFIVRLPLMAEAPILPTGDAENSGSTAIAARRILIVDDNRDAAESLALLLEHLAAEARAIHDGPAALAALGSYQPSVMISDIGMPDMDGYEVARRVREQPDGGDLTLIALTGWGQADDRRRSKAAGFNHHLVKPANLDALRQLLASLP